MQRSYMLVLLVMLVFVAVSLRCGSIISPDFAGSCHAMIRNEVVVPLGLGAGQFFMPPTQAEDFARAARDFEAQIQRRGGVDLQILGLGENGHLGFNQLGTPFHSDTWHSRMDPTLEARIRRESGTPEDVPLGGLTLGLRTLMQSRRIVLAANGAHKARIVQAAFQGPVTPEVPASVLQLHPFCEVILDPAAAARLASPAKPGTA